jgi:hypothetical protein
MKKTSHIFQISVLCLAALFVMPSLAQTDARDTNQKQRSASAIFDEIMQTLPADMKAKVDSASCESRADVKSNAVKPQQSAKPASLQNNRDGAVQELPEDVRGKVEKAISEIDLGNQNRQIQFKEFEKKRQGGK